MAKRFPIQEPNRSSIALGLCGVSAVVGAWLLVRKSVSPSSGAFYLWAVWSDTAYWLAHRHWLIHREGRHMLGKTPAEIYRIAKAGGLTLQSTVAQTIKRCSECMILTAVVCLFIQ